MKFQTLFKQPLPIFLTFFCLAVATGLLWLALDGDISKNNEPTSSSDKQEIKESSEADEPSVDQPPTTTEGEDEKRPVAQPAHIDLTDATDSDGITEETESPRPPPAVDSLVRIVQDDATATASGQGLSNFVYFTSEVEPICSAQNSDVNYREGQKASSLQDGHWVCFRAESSSGQYHFASLEIDLSSPRITISQFKDEIEVDAQTFNSASLIDDSWQKFITPAGNEPDCDGDDFSESKQSSEGKDISIDKADNNRWLCYRVSNSLGVYGYDKYQLDYNAPTITISVSQDGKTLTASTVADDLPENPQWRKSGPNNSSDCNADTDFTPGNVISGIVSQKYYCFSVADKAGNEDFAEFFTQQTATSAPAAPVGPRYNLVIQQDGSLVKVDTTRSSNIAGFTLEYFISQSSDDPNCSPSNTTATYQAYDSSTHVPVTNDERWVCFKATKGTQELFAKIQVDLKRPVIEVDRDQYLLTATATSTSRATIVDGSWENFKATATTGPNCQAPSNSALYSTPNSNNRRVAITTDTKWVCFRVKTSKGVAGYKRHQLPTLPTISASQKLTSIKTAVTSSATGAVVDLDDGDSFGESIALDGDYLAVGAPYDDGHSTTTIDSKTVSETGAVYIFKRIGTVWFLDQKNC